jgi:hypothetical protein
MTDDRDDDLGMAVAHETLREKGWIVPRYDEDGQRIQRMREAITRGG